MSYLIMSAIVVLYVLKQCQFKRFKEINLMFNYFLINIMNK